MMPTSVAAILVFVFAIFPGFLGNRVYESFVGFDWREREWRAVMRLSGLSVAGAVLYNSARIGVRSGAASAPVSKHVPESHT